MSKCVGITGGIGAGKTIICKIFELLNVPVYYADDQAKLLMVKNEALKKSIIKSFGNASYLENGEINKPFLRQLFHDPKNIIKLNALVHPKVSEDFWHWTNKHHDAKYILKEAALLIESGSYKDLDALICITAPEEKRIKRVLKRDSGRNKENISQIIAAQIRDDVKIKYSDFTIRNDGMHLVTPQVLKINNALKK
ncbi:MAG TPA: dephospho-CoA kinase [Cyclobacteriaceae bacterium]